MNKRKLNYYHRRFQIISPWYFLVGAFIFLAIGVYGLRQNNFTMIKLRQAVITADEKNGNVEKALDELRTYVYSHMNTNLSSGQNAIKPPIQLKNRYEKLVKAQEGSVEAYNKTVQQKGEAICAREFPALGYNAPRVACVQDYVGAHAKTAADEIPAELYKFDFVSPKWSPDLAGISLLISSLLFLLFVLRFSVERWFKHELK
jgi:hypothetical protein